MNRAQRRRCAARADATAAILARTTHDRGEDGAARHVADPLAQAALRRAFAHVLRHGEGCHVMRLSAREAAAFPSPPDTGGGGGAWLAVGFDRDGRGTYALRGLHVAGAPDALAERRLIEAAMLAELAPTLSERWTFMPCEEQ